MGTEPELDECGHEWSEEIGFRYCRLCGTDSMRSPAPPAFWTVRHFGIRPYLLNQERKDHPRTRAKQVKIWREAFSFAAMVSDLPRPIPGPIHIGVAPMLKGRWKQDVGACFPTAKAAIDGLCDAGFLPNDEPEWVRMLSFCAPTIGQPDNGLVLYVRLVQ